MDIYTKVIKKFGKTHQILKAVEELYELKVELLQVVNHGNINKAAIITEIADVYNMLIQLEIIFEIEGIEISKEMNRKMEIIFNKISSKNMLGEEGATVETTIETTEEGVESEGHW
jgi:NTP pyrophosphatase (non-canonical NTP hydrolase)